MGLFGPKQGRNGKVIEGYLKKRSDVKKQICELADFRSKIASELKRNLHSHGIPQGIPISDLLANIVLRSFDLRAQHLAVKQGGLYRRYCDDILLILPRGSTAIAELMTQLASALSECGPNLRFKKKKEQVYHSQTDGSGTQSITRVSGGANDNSIDYLGLNFDGRKVRFRNSTLSRLRRRIVQQIRSRVRHLIESNPDANLESLRKSLNLQHVCESFGRVKALERYCHGVSSKRFAGNFRCYATRVNTQVEPSRSILLRQLAGQSAFIRERAHLETERAYLRHLRRASK